MRILIGVVAALLGMGSVVACSSVDDGSTSSLTSGLTGDGTIARVPNPPLPSDLANMPSDLRSVPVPQPAGIEGYVKDTAAAIRLGKALFWDMQVSSDGVQACASCHLWAGADPRSKNQLSPGLNHAPQADHSFQSGGPNAQVSEASFPLTRLAVPPGSPGFPSGQRGALDPATDSNDAVGSQGVHYLGDGIDPDGFNVGAYKTRRVTPRNAPSVINAVFNHRQFWDGRAENVFNGVNHLGARDPNARVLRAASKGSTPVPVQVAISGASLASQALGPIVSDIEQAAPGRSVQDVARALTKSARVKGKAAVNKRPLFGQLVDEKDSVLGRLSNKDSPA